MWYGGEEFGYSGFQSAIAMATNLAGDPYVYPHHPITCQSQLRLEEDGSFSCEHMTMPPGDLRTQGCLDHSIAALIIELAMKL